MKNRFPFYLGLPLLLLAGCSQSGAPTDPVKGIAASIVAARSFDQASIAIDRQDAGGLAKARDDLKLAAKTGSNHNLTIVTATFLTNKASDLTTRASLSANEERDNYLRQSDEIYRAALASVPEQAPEKSLAPNTLNALGYFLADRGKSRADFEKAAQYTLAAYKSWPMLSGPNEGLSRVERALLPQDSHAWALYKLGKFEEARVQQEEVLETTQSIAPEQLSADIVFHMAEIYRSVGERDKARAQYKLALSLTSDADLKAKINAGLQALEFRQV